MAKTPRLALITEEIADAEQRRVGDLIYRHLEPFQGPSAVLLQVPELADRVVQLRDHVRNAGMRNDLLQLVTLVTARHWSANYVWTVREEMAREAGIAASVIDAIRRRQRPDFTDRDQQAIYTYVMELLGPVGVSDAVHAGVVAVLGEKGVIELVAAVGVYTILALTTRAADLPIQPGATPLAK